VTGSCYDRRMRISLAFALLLAAACGPAPKPEGPIVKEGSAAPDNCCCKTTPIASVDGLPVFEPQTGRLECSTRQGVCVDDVQCQGKEPPPAPVTPDPGPLDGT
jgi:hypothetical protein